MIYKTIIMFGYAACISTVAVGASTDNTSIPMTQSTGNGSAPVMPSENNATGAPMAQQSTPLNPLSPAGQHAKEERVLNEYFARNTSPGEVYAGVYTASNEQINEGNRVDGMNLEDIHGPTQHDADIPLDPESQKRQQSMENDLITQRNIENFMQTEDTFLNEPGAPDNEGELALRVQENRGNNVRPDPMTYEQAALHAYPVTLP